MSENVLVYRPGSLGDTIVGIPALAAVRSYFGKAAVITLLRDQSKPEVTPEDVMAGHSAVDRFMAYPGRLRGAAALKAFTGLLLEIRRRQFDAIVYLAPAERPAAAVRRDKLFYTLAGIRRKIGFSVFPKSELYSRTATGRPAPVAHEAEFLLRKLAKEGFAVASEPRPDLELSPEESRAAGEWIERSGAKGRSLLAVAPGANQPANFWPIERFETLGRRLVDTLGCVPVVFGGGREAALSSRLISAWGAGVSAAGILNPRQAAAVIARCRLFLGLDSGPVHLAAAVGTPIVALYSDRDHPGRFHPLAPSAVVLRHSVPCGGCRRSVCPVAGHPCLESIGVDEVFEAVCRTWRKSA